MQDFREVVFSRLDRGETLWQQMVVRQILDAQAADGDAVSAEITAGAAEFIVDGVAVIEDEVSLLGRITPAVDHVDAGSLIDEHNFAEVVVFMHAARHMGSIFANVADIFKSWRSILAEGGAIAMIREILKQ